MFTEGKTKGRRIAYIQDFFSPFILLPIFTTENSRVLSCDLPWGSWAQTGNHSACFVFWGPRSVCDELVVWGHGMGTGAVYLGRYQRAGGTNPKQAGLLGQRNSWLEGHGIEEMSKVRGKKNIHLFLLQFRQLGEHSAGGMSAKAF